MLGYDWTSRILAVAEMGFHFAGLKLSPTLGRLAAYSSASAGTTLPV